MSSAPDKTGGKIGMWLFLYSEIMLFGGLFILYAAYYHRYTADFVAGGKALSQIFGTANTLILLFSSFTVASAVTACKSKSQRLTVILLGSSIVLGLIFLLNKYLEWSQKFEHGIFPGSAELANGPMGRNIFFSLYYLITGLHGLHVIIGLALLAYCLTTAARHQGTFSRQALLENAALYWHLVDLVWIFVFPLFYLIL